jgi:succinoglycan biosynthesis transport protein ExoP
MNVEAGFQLDLVGALRRRLWMIVSVIGAVFLIAYQVAMVLPNYYRSWATIFVEPQAISQELVEAGLGESDLTQRLSLMSAEILSRSKLSRVIDDLDLYQEESKTMLRVEIIEMMRSRISVEPVISELAASVNKSKKGSDLDLNTFVVIFVDKNPLVTAKVAQHLANDFVNRHIEARVAVTEKGLEFIEGELERLSEHAKKVQSQIAELKNANAGSLPEDLPTSRRLLENTLAELRQAERKLDEAVGNQSFWEAQEMMMLATSDPRDDLSPARRLQLLEMRLAEYRSRGFTEKHPDILQVEQEVAQMRAQMSTVDPQGGEQQPRSVAQQTVMAQKQKEVMKVEAAEKEIARLREQADEIELRIIATPRVAEQLEGLDSQALQLSTSLKDFFERRQAARVRVALERRQLGEQFRILEPAYPALAPSSPNRPLILIMGVIGGIALALGAALALEGVDSSFHVVRDLQSALSIPVLAAIPNILLESDHILRRRRRMRNALAASLVVVISLAGGFATHMYVNGMPGWLNALVSGEESEEDGEQGVSLGRRPEDRT